MRTILTKLIFISALAVSADDITYNFNIEDFTICDYKGEDGMTYSRFLYQGKYLDGYSLEDEFKLPEILCAPEIPYKQVCLDFPTNASEYYISFEIISKTSHQLSNKIYPIQKRETTGFGQKHEFYPCDEGYYNSVLSYPRCCIEYHDRYHNLIINPILYYPMEDRYEFISEVKVKLKYGNPNRDSIYAAQNRINPTSLPFYEYCVITNQTLASSFDRLIAWTREKGRNAGVITIEQILSDSVITGDTISNIYDNAGKIRQYLQYGHDMGIIRSVLFGGNNEILPIRYGSRFNNPRHLMDDLIPTDFYFSNLDSNWNRDGDSFYGEPEDSIHKYSSSLSVGRLLCTSPEEVHNYTDKLLRYELNPGNGDFSYLSRAFLFHADQMQRDREAQKIANDFADIFTDTLILEETPSFNATVTTFPTGKDVIDAMKEHYGYVSWMGHGHPNSITSKSDGVMTCNCYGISSVPGNIPFMNYEDSCSLVFLDNKNHPMIVYSISCSTTPFDTYANYIDLPNIGQSFTLGKEYGGPALIGNTREGTVGISSDFQKEFNQMMRTRSLGESLNFVKDSLFQNHHHSLVVNIIGCPDIRVWTKQPSYFNAVLDSTSSDENYLHYNLFLDSLSICMRNISEDSEYSTKIRVPNIGSTNLANVDNCLITLIGNNCIPQIMPLTLNNMSLRDKHYLITSDVSTHDIDFTDNSQTTIENSGVVKLDSNVRIEQGAGLRIIPTKIYN